MFMWIFYVIFGSFSNRSKVIVKDVSNIIVIGYSITLSRESAICRLKATVLRKIRDLIPFHEFLMLF